ncbi:hypothetical protein [Deinococcus aestuarii]|uniref:hypothetical protein n=1 Tax=Deinococcus aestuarii TaxID=2774531 RepID=UPI001C0B7E8C|nr:hypothetical protein [Deinococcus aestuarii]
MHNEVVVLGTHGDRVVCALYRKTAQEWSPLSEPFALPPLHPGQTRELQVRTHPAVQDKLERGAELLEVLVGQGTPGFTGTAQALPEGVALTVLARAAGLPAYPATAQQIITLDLSSSGITAAVVEADASGNYQLLTNHFWPPSALPASWDVPRSLLAELLPPGANLSPALVADVQRQVDAYIQERDTFQNTPALELILPLLARRGQIRFEVADSVFRSAVEAVVALIRRELAGRYDPARGTFLVITGDRSSWPGVGDLELPGRVTRFASPPPSAYALALGAALSPAGLPPALAHPLTVRVRHAGTSVEVMTMGLPETQEFAAQDLPVTFAQRTKDQPLEAVVELEAEHADGQSFRQQVNLRLPPQGPGWKVFRRGDTPLEERGVTVRVQAAPLPGAAVRLRLEVVNERQVALRGVWHYRHAGGFQADETRTLEVVA